MVQLKKIKQRVEIVVKKLSTLWWLALLVAIKTTQRLKKTKSKFLPKKEFCSFKIA